MNWMLGLTWAQAAAWRLRRHHLHERAPAGSLLAVASRLCGLHAQVLSSAELTAWVRVESLDRGTVQQALWNDRTLVKTWAMRGTLHLLPSVELRLWHAALSMSRRYRSPAQWKKYFGISMADLDRLNHAIGLALDGRVLTREELVLEVKRHTRSKALVTAIAQSSWGTVLKPAAFAGRLCFGPGLGQRVRFTCPDSWLGTASPKIEPHVATAEITRRFLAAYAPATAHDLARWWGGGGVAAARQWIAALGDEVAPVDLDGTNAWMLSAHAAEARALPPLRSARLLPGFDQYVVGSSHHADHLLPGKLRHRVFRPQGWISPVLLVNGLMEGVWRHEIKGSRVTVVVEPFRKPPAWVRRAAGLEAERFAHFLGLTLDLAWKSG